MFANDDVDEFPRSPRPPMPTPPMGSMPFGSPREAAVVVGALALAVRERWWAPPTLWELKWWCECECECDWV